MTTWGRDPVAGKWIHEGPRFTALAGLFAVAVFAWLAHFQFQQLSPLQREWFQTFVWSTAAASLDLPALPYALNGHGEKIRRDNAEVRDYAGRVFDGEPLWRVMSTPVIGGAVALGLLIPAIGLDLRRNRQRQRGRYIKGAKRLDATPFNRAIRPRRLRRGFRRDEPGMEISQRGAATIVLPRTIDNSHALIVGDTSAGKTTIINQYCEYAEATGQTVVLWDADGAFYKTWGKPERGDVLLNPGDVRTWAWDSADEVRDPLEALALAQSLIKQDPAQTNKFFSDSARAVVAYLLSLKLSPQQLVGYLTNQKKLLALLKGTTIEDVLPRNSSGQRAGVMSPLNLVAVTLGLCPTPEECDGRVWSAAQWASAENPHGPRGGWIFIAGQPTMRAQLQPLQTLWIDALILRMMTTPGPPTKIIFDELAAAQKIWQLHLALTEGRRHGLSILVGFQGFGQIEALYLKSEVETMFSQPAAKYFLRVSGPDSAKIAAETIGQAEIERMEESRSHGYRRHGASFVMRRAFEYLFMPAEVQGLDDLYGILKVRNYVTTLQIPVINRQTRQEAFVPRAPRPLPIRPSVPPHDPNDAPPLEFDPPLPPDEDGYRPPLE